MMKGEERRGGGGGETLLTIQKSGFDAKRYSQTPNPMMQPPSKLITVKPTRLLCFYSEDESTYILQKNTEECGCKICGALSSAEC